MKMMATMDPAPLIDYFCSSGQMVRTEQKLMKQVCAASSNATIQAICPFVQQMDANEQACRQYANTAISQLVTNLPAPVQSRNAQKSACTHDQV